MALVSKKKKVLVIGSGPGGLSSAIILANNGYEVEIFEKKDSVGGRNSSFKLGDFTFDLGPTFLMMPQVVDEIFELSGERACDHLDLRKLDPMYCLYFGDGEKFNVYSDSEKFKEEIRKFSREDAENYDKYMAREKVKFERTYHCLKVPYTKIYHYLRPELLKAIPVMDLHTSVYGVLKKYFKEEKVRLAMTFQSKYLGMSAWDCPGAFTMISYIEHAFGIFHPIGGLNMLSKKMAEVAYKKGVKINFNTKIKEILLEGKKAVGVLTGEGKRINSDFVIMNADFGDGVSKMIKNVDRPSWNDKKLKKTKYSCSTLMFYWGLKNKHDLPHHNIIFAKDYKKNIKEIFDGSRITDPSFYLQNASVTDSTLAPQGKSTFYVLVPVPNLDTKLDWDKEVVYIREKILEKISERLGIKNIKEEIEVERIIKPIEWSEDYSVFKGGVFNLSHNLSQMLYMRPHNEFNDIKNLYIVGGGTHPGSGLPTILESGRIASDMIQEKGSN
jgi:phytoene desaturase